MESAYKVDLFSTSLTEVVIVFNASSSILVGIESLAVELKDRPKSDAPTMRKYMDFIG